MRNDENAALVRRITESWPETSAEVDEWIREIWEPDGDFYPVKKWPESRPCHGHDEIARFMTEMSEAWDTWAMDVEAVAAVDEIRVVARVNLRAQGLESGAVLEGDLFQCLWIRNGRYLRAEDHLTIEGLRNGIGDDSEAARALALFT